MKKYLPYAVALLVGVVVADRVRSLPVLDKLPSL